MFYLTGTDEHGTKVERTARDNGVEPQVWCDRLVEDSWKPVLQTIDAANDDFIRTTSERHRLGVQKFWQTLRDNGPSTRRTSRVPTAWDARSSSVPAI